VLLGPDGPRVVDFGIARLTDAATITSGLIGTPSYVAPEQLAGRRPTSAVDIFAWALTMIYAATGHLAFGADSVPAVMHRIMYEQPDVSGLPPSLRAVVLECLDKDPARRPSARDLLLRLVDPSAPRTPVGPPADDLADSVPHTGPVYPPAEPTFPGREPTQLSVPGREPTQLSVPGQGPARSRRTPILVVGGAVAAAAVVLAVVLLTRGSPPASRADSGGNSLAGSASSPAATASQSTSPPPATSGATIPATFAGTWKGKATMAAVGDTGVGLPNNVTFTFAAGARTIHETDEDSYGGSCVNTLTLREATATVLTFDEPQAGGCVAGTTTFTRHGTSLVYRWTDNIEQNSATLRKS
jgi:serine/threonine protein kinase